MTDTSDVERLNRIRAAFTILKAGWIAQEAMERAAGVQDAFECLEANWEPLYSGKSEDRGK